MQTCPIAVCLLGARAPIIVANFSNVNYLGPHAKYAELRKNKRVGQSLVDGVASLV